jgi:putative Holliday junction resolvase
MAYLVGVDYGTRRTGLAVSDATGKFVLPLDTVAMRGRAELDAATIVENCLDYDVAGFVIGLPLNMDGREGPQARLTRAFGDALARISGKPVHYWDERLSSFAAEETLRDSDLTRRVRREKTDRIAAQMILEEYLAHQPEGT